MARKYKGRSEAQHRATMNNFCLRALSGLESSFRKAGHHDFEQLVHALETKFRTKLRETADGYENTKEATK